MASKPRDIADRMASRNLDGFVRETYALSRIEARAKAKDILRRYPKAAYMTEIEHWRELPDDGIEFTIRHLRSAD